MEVPKGYRIERKERRGRLGEGETIEVAFVVYEPADGDRRVVQAYASLNSRLSEWVVVPGGSVSHCEANEARARATALLMAAEEVDRRNDAPEAS
jgi:hypothetical protein